MVRNLSILFLLSVLILVGGNAYAKCKRIQGTSSGIISNDCGSVIPNGCFSGTVKGGLKGDVQLKVLTAESNPNPDVFFLTGVTTFKNSAGHKLIGRDSISVNIDGNSADLIVWTGGDGEFEFATGHAVLDATSDFTKMTFETQWAGEICTP